MAKRGGNPANRKGGRTTPKGTVPVKSTANKVRDEKHRARVTGRKPRPAMKVGRDFHKLMKPVQAALLRALADDLEGKTPTNSGTTIKDT